MCVLREWLHTGAHRVILRAFCEIHAKLKLNIIERCTRRRGGQSKTKKDLQCWNRSRTLTFLHALGTRLHQFTFPRPVLQRKQLFFFFLNYKWKSFFFGLQISVVDKVLMSCLQVVAVSWKPLAILFVRGWNCLRKKKEERKGEGKKIEGFLGGCFKMLSPCFAPAEKLGLKLSSVPYGYLLSAPVLATSEQTAWSGFDSPSSPLLPICCFTLDHEVCQPSCAGSEIKQRLLSKCCWSLRPL